MLHFPCDKSSFFFFFTQNRNKLCIQSNFPLDCNSPAVTVSWAVLFMEPYGLDAVQLNRPPSSGKASAITRVQISSEDKKQPSIHDSRNTKPFVILHLWSELGLISQFISIIKRYNNECSDLLTLDLFIMRCYRGIRWTGRWAMYMVDRWWTFHAGRMSHTVFILRQQRAEGRQTLMKIRHINTEAQMFRDVWVTHGLRATPWVTPDSHRWEMLMCFIINPWLCVCLSLCVVELPRL